MSARERLNSQWRAAQAPFWKELNPRGTAQVLFKFTATGPHQLSLERDEQVELVEINGKWFRGRLISAEGSCSDLGIFPAAFVEILSLPEQEDSPARPKQKSPRRRSDAPLTKGRIATVQGQASSSGSSGSCSAIPSRPVRKVRPPSAKLQKRRSIGAAAARGIVPPVAVPEAPIGAANTEKGEGAAGSSTEAEEGRGRSAATVRARPKPRRAPPAPPSGIVPLDNLPPPAGAEAKPRKPSPRLSVTLSKDGSSSQLDGAPKPNLPPLPPPSQNDGFVRRKNTLESPRVSVVDVNALSDSVTKRAEDDRVMTICAEDPVVNKVTKHVLSWSQLMREFWNDEKWREFRIIRNFLAIMVTMRRRLLQTTDEVQKTTLRRDLLNRLSEGRRLMGYDMVLRSPRSGVKKNHLNTSPVELHFMHKELRAKDVARSGRSRIVTMAKNKPQPEDLGSPRGSTTNAKGVPSTRMVLLEFQTVICKINESIECSFALYDAVQKTIVTEEYLVKCSASGMPEDQSLIGNAKTVFKDITEEERSTLSLVVRVVRLGKVQAEFSSKKSKSDPSGIQLRRPVGWGVLPLAAIRKGSSLREHRLPLWMSASDQFFGNGPEMILKSSKEFVESSDCCVAAKLALVGVQGESMGRGWKGVRVTSSIAFTPSPDVRRNDLYISLVEGDLSKEKTGSFEISVTARKADGSPILDAAAIGPGHKLVTVYNSMVFYHQNNPRWCERIRFTIPPQHFDSIHFLFEVRQWSQKEKSKQKPAIAFGYFVPSNHNGTVIENNRYEIPLFKMSKSGTDDPSTYLDQDMTDQSSKLKLTIETSLASNKLIQQDLIFYLVNWQKHSDKISESLNGLPNADPNVVITFLSPILGALFGILATNAKLSMFIYNNVIHVILLILEDKTQRFSSFRHELDKFIDGGFSASGVHQPFLDSLLYYLRKMESKNHQKYIMMSSKALYYVFKLVCASHRNELARLESEEERQEAARKVESKIGEVVTCYAELLRSADKQCLPLQTVTLKSFPTSFALLNDLFPPEQLLQLFKEFFTAIPDKKALSSPKLEVLLSLVGQNFYVHNEELVKQVAIVVTRTGAVHLNRSREEEMASLSILLKFCSQAHKAFESSPEISALLFKLIEPLCNTILNPKGSSSTRLDAITLFLYIFHVSTREHIDTELRSSSLVGVLVQTLLSILRKGYDRSWFAMWMFAYVTGAKIVPIISSFLPSQLDHFDKEVKLWGSFFDVCLAFVSAPHLQVEEATRKPKVVTDIYPKDIRVEICTIFVQLWEEVGLNQMKLVSSMIGPSVDLMLLPSVHLKQMGMQLYASLLRRAIIETGSVEEVYLPTIDALIKISKEQEEKLSEFQSFFLSRLSEMFEGTGDEIERKGMAMHADLRQLVSLLKEFDTIPEGIEWDDERTVATLKLMEFFKESNRTAPYITYVHELASAHESAKRMPEAGLAILLHASLLDWSNKTLEPILSFKAEPNAVRKERLYRQAIKYFDASKSWERSIALRDELAAHLRETHSYLEVAQLMREQAETFELLAVEERYSAEYFRVAFYGKGFPPSLKGKEFVYRGFECERITAFISRMQSIYPKAELIRTNKDVTDDVIEGDGQWFVIAKVTPSSMWELKGQEMPRDLLLVPENVKRYRLISDINVFTYSKPFRKNPEKSSNEFEDLWIANHFLITAETFPGVLSRSEVIEKHVVESSPIVNAIQSIDAKNKDIVGMCKRCTEDSSSSHVNALTMALNGVIDAEVNGGIKMYQQAFFIDEFIQRHPEHAGNVERLKEVLRDSVDVLEMALRVHRTVCPPNLQALQDKMEVFFEKMKTEIRRTCL